MNTNIFEDIEKLYEMIDKEISDLYVQINKLKDYEKPEYLRLLCNFKYANEMLYGHDGVF